MGGVTWMPKSSICSSLNNSFSWQYALNHQTPILDYFVKFLWLILIPHDMLIYTNPQICKAPFTRHLIWVESGSDFLSSGLSKTTTMH